MGDSNAPTVKPNKGVKFYNPGDRFSEPIRYTLPGIGGDIHCVANWTVTAEEKGFFQVPTELRLLMDGTRINVDFPTTVLQRFKDRGVICIDDEWEPGEDEDRNERMPFARNDQEAQVKGDAKWIKYLQGIVRNHIEACQRAKSAGGFPLEAQGFTKRAFKLLNMKDPAALAFAEMQTAQNAPAAVQSDEAASLRAELDETKRMLQKVLDRLAAKETADDDAAIENQAAPTGGKGKKAK